MNLNRVEILGQFYIRRIYLTPAQLDGVVYAYRPNRKKLKHIYADIKHDPVEFLEFAFDRLGLEKELLDLK